MKKLGILVVALVLLAGTAFAAGSKEGASDKKAETAMPKIVWKLSHTGVPEHPYHLGAVKLAEYVAKETNGNFQIDVFHSSTLGWEREVLEAMQLGTIAMTWAALGPYAQFASGYEVFNLPFIFSSEEHMGKVLENREIMQKLKDHSKEKGFYDLGLAGKSFRIPINNVRPINKPEDFVGVKFRTMGVPVHIDSYKALGANVATVAFAELYSAMQLGVVNGAENTASSLYNMKFYEVQKYVTFLPILNNLCVLAASKVAYDKLPDSYKKILESGSKLAVDTYNSVQDRLDLEAIEIMKKAGIQFTRPDVQPFIQATAGVRDKYLAAMEPWVKDLSKKIMETK